MAEEKEETITPTEEPKKEEKKEFKLVDVTTQTAPMIQGPDGELITDSQALVMLLNEVKEVKNLVG